MSALYTVALAATATASSSSWLKVYPRGSSGFADLSIYSNSAASAVATVYLQRSFDDGTTALDVTQYTLSTTTISVQQTIEFATDQNLRLAIKTGGYTSGTIIGALYHGGYHRTD